MIPKTCAYVYGADRLQFHEKRRQKSRRCAEFYYIATMAEEPKITADTTLACFRGYADCVEGAVEKGVIIGNGVYEPGKIKGTPAMEQAYQMGKNV